MTYSFEEWVTDFFPGIKAAASFFRISGYSIMNRKRQNGAKADAGYYEEEMIWHVFWYLRVNLWW